MDPAIRITDHHGRPLNERSGVIHGRMRPRVFLRGRELDTDFAWAVGHDGASIYSYSRCTHELLKGIQAREVSTYPAFWLLVDLASDSRFSRQALVRGGRECAATFLLSVPDGVWRGAFPSGPLTCALEKSLARLPLPGPTLHSARVASLLFGYPSPAEGQIGIRLGVSENSDLAAALSLGREVVDIVVSHAEDALVASVRELVSEKRDYDVALSFAGEDRGVARDLAKRIQNDGHRVFFDEYERAGLWGQDLYTHLSHVYRKRARFCVMIISAHYATKVWPTHERRAAQARALEESREYILPVRLDDAEVPGVLPTTGYLDLRHHSINEVAALLTLKLRSL